MAASNQLRFTFDVGGATPDTATLKISGALELGRELRKGEEIGVRVVDADGDVIAQGDGYVTAVAFKDKRDKDGDVVETERAPAHVARRGRPRHPRRRPGAARNPEPAGARVAPATVVMRRPRPEVGGNAGRFHTVCRILH